jgi:hypothetical protein
MRTSAFLVLLAAIALSSEGLAEIRPIPRAACEGFADRMRLKGTSGIAGISRTRFLDWCMRCVEYAGPEGQSTTQVCPLDPAPECDDEGCHFDELREWRAQSEPQVELQQRVEELRKIDVGRN